MVYFLLQPEVVTALRVWHRYDYSFHLSWRIIIIGQLTGNPEWWSCLCYGPLWSPLMSLFRTNKQIKSEGAIQAEIILAWRCFSFGSCRSAGICWVDCLTLADDAVHDTDIVSLSLHLVGGLPDSC